tara:strand:- start:626 stop:859 length:234 start_codon:yes stop_codon:yes gene_type:complete
MKNFNLFSLKTFLFISLFLLSLFSYKSIDKNNIDNSERDKFIIKLKKCLDLDNKSSRRISVSINLVEYCMRTHGDIK